MGNWLIKAAPTGAAIGAVRWKWEAADERSRASFGLLGRRGFGYSSTRELAEKAAKGFVDSQEAARSFLYTPDSEAT